MSVMYITDAQEIPFKLFFWGKRKNIEGTQKLYMEVKLEILSQKCNEEGSEKKLVRTVSLFKCV